MTNMNTYVQNQSTNATSVDRPLPNSTIFVALEGVAKRIAELHQAIDDLGQKLSPALRPVPVMMAGAGKIGAEPPAVESDLTQLIRKHAAALDVLLQQVVDIRERSEV